MATSKERAFRQRAFSIACIALLGGCSWGGSTTTSVTGFAFSLAGSHAPTAAAARRGTYVVVNFTVDPPAAQEGRGRAAQGAGVSPASRSIVVQISGTTHPAVALSPKTPGCSPSGGGLSCALTFAAAPATNAPVVAQTYASVNGSGLALSIGNASVPIVAHKTSTVTPAFGDIGRSITVTVSPASFTIGIAGSAVVAAAILDAAGIPIVDTPVDPKGNPIAGSVGLADSDTSGTTQLSGSSLAYSGQLIQGPISITGTLSYLTPGSAKVAFITGSSATPKVILFNGTQIVEFSAEQRGNAAPIRVLALPSAQSSLLVGTDSNADIFECVYGNPLQFVTYDKAGTLLRTLSISGLGANPFCGLDPHQNTYTLDLNANVMEFAAGASGSGKSIRSFQAQFVSTNVIPLSITADEKGDVFIGSSCFFHQCQQPPPTDEIDEYPPLAGGTVPPSRTILNSSGDVGVGRSGRLVVSCIDAGLGMLYVPHVACPSGGGYLYTFPPNASGPTPPRTIATTGIFAAAADRDGNIYASATDGKAYRVAYVAEGTGRLTTLIAGAKTDLNVQPVAIAVRP